MGEGTVEETSLEKKLSGKAKRVGRLILGAITSEALRQRTASLMWEAENDPFQVFEVEHESCLDLEIEVKRGENVTKGSAYQDFCDTPDPYVILRVPGSSNSSKRTSHIDNTVNPIWNETFHFYLDPKRHHILYITLMDANMIMSDETLGENILDVNSLPLDTPANYIIEFTGGSKVHVTLKLQTNKNPDLRFSLALCEEEKEFLRARRMKVMNNMQKLLGDRGPKFKEEVPIVAVLGSGGGFRAMTGFSGVVKALHQSGILGCSAYISGLSGSSWFISTLYAHEKFPNMTYDEMFEELQQSVTQNWKWKLTRCHLYLLDMIKKHRGGQPVSFTDIFGHLLGDVLLHGQKHKKLSDQRRSLHGGAVPLPLYTCLHAKASVSCKAFSEWIEFSPFEIGIAKYGTFMKTEDFGSKFVVGKLIKRFPEFPLHYLQGVWGSAFTILMKRLVLEGGSKQDIVEMMREVHEERAVQEKLEAEYLSENTDDHPLEKESETDDEDDVQGADDKFSEEDESSDKENNNNLEKEINEMRHELKEKQHLEEEMWIRREHKHPFFEQPHGKDHKIQFQISRPSNENLNEMENKISRETKTGTAEPSSASKEDGRSKKKFHIKGLSFEFPKNSTFDFIRKTSRDEDAVRKISSHSDPGIAESYQPATTNMEVRKGRFKRQGAIREHSVRSLESTTTNSDFWKEKRKLRKTKRMKNSTVIQDLLKNSNILNSRAGRAGEILNPFRGLSLKQSFPLSPFSVSADEAETDDVGDNELGLGSRYEALDNTAKKLFIVDSGLAFNSPYPLLLRPQRAVDMYLSFDFSQRPSDRHMPFKELLIAEKWAKQNKVSFPPVEKQVAEFAKDTHVKELYIFKDDTDPFCPVILHFTIVNNKFKWEKAPGVPRETKEELDFADFSLFEEPSQPYASTNFVYSHLQYERLVKLMEYNTLLCLDTIKEELAALVSKKRKLALRTLEHTFAKMQNVMDACKKFKKTGGLQLRFDENEGRKFINAWRQSSFQISKELATNAEDSQAIFYDAFDSLDSGNEKSDYETDEGP